ncbi:coiled-coil domain-containing protein 141-like [Channa argus]|uniref:coiled-coil domain-containing protein 141-like n=1 Tax=Channa argus TaxID=215402 RepID=UPI00352003B1
MEDLRIRPDHKQLGEIQVIYGSMRKELLEKSLQVLSSSSVLLHKLRQLQKTEALQRRGAVMEDKEQEDEGSQCSTGVILKLEELVEKLHDRRRKLDQAAMLQIQLVESSIKYCKEEGSLRQSSYMNWSPDKFPYQTWQSGSTPAEMSDLATHSRTKDLHPGSRSGEAAVLDSGYKSKELQHEPALNTQSDSTLKQAADVSFSELSRKDETKQHREVTSRQVAGQESMMGKETQSGVHTHQTFLTNQRQQLLLSCQQLMDKVWSWVQQGNRVLSYSCEVGRQLPEAEDSLNTHLQLHTQAQSADHDAEKLRQILDQIRALQTDQVTRTSHYCPSEANRQLSPLKALTEQLKRGITGKQTRSRSTWSGPEVVDAPCTISPELAGGVEVVLSELQSLNRKIDANLQLLQPYISFLRKAQQVEQEMEELREIYRRKPEKEEESQVSCSDIGSPQKKKEEMLQTFLTAQYLGNDYVHTVTMVSGSGLNLLSLVSVVQQTMERLRRTQQEVNKMQSFQQIQIQYQQEDMKYCKKYQERLFKNQQDLKCVSELLDSCTLMDLGSDLQTSSLLERFSQARPHFIQLDAEVEYMEKSWETVRAVQDRLKAKALMGRTMGDEDLSELLKLHKRVNDKIQQTELILELSSSFHLTSKQVSGAKK